METKAKRTKTKAIEDEIRRSLDNKPAIKLITMEELCKKVGFHRKTAKKYLKKMKDVEVKYIQQYVIIKKK